MPEFDYDLFVIGAGSGGVRAARMSASLGAKVAIAEDRYLGGTCVNVGCVPKKLFVYASHFTEDFEIARSFGWSIDNTNFDWRSLIDNKDTEIERLNHVYQKILDDAGVETITGRATLIDANTIGVNDNSYTAERILIATGGWPSLPDLPGIEFAITSNEIFHLESLPDRIVIVGGGYIAVEFACILQGMGVETTLLYRGPLFLRGFDQDLREILADEMGNKGIKLLFNTNVTGITKTDSILKVQLTPDQQLITNTIMFATGRTPKTANIGLEEVGVKLDSNSAIVVNDNYQSSVPSIYAIGDVIDRVKLTPVALAEGMVLAKSLFSNQSIKVNYADIPTCVFSQPNLGTVGLTEEEARERHNEIVVYKSRFKPMKLSLSDSNEKTFMKLIVDKASDHVVGIHMVGPDAGEIIQGMAIAMKAGATKSTFDATIGIHPTSAEEFVTMREPV
jgi:glutathione reductase (NADPH)